MNYLLTINDPRFHLSIPFQILPNETTKVTVGFKWLEYPVTFQEYDDRFATGFSGGPGDTVFLRIDSKISIPKVHDVVMLEMFRDSSNSVTHSHSSKSLTFRRAIVVGESLTNNSLFLQVQPEAITKVEGILDMSIVIYNPIYVVTISSG